MTLCKAQNHTLKKGRPPGSAWSPVSLTLTGRCSRPDGRLRAPPGHSAEALNAKGKTKMGFMCHV